MIPSISIRPRREWKERLGKFSESFGMSIAKAIEGDYRVCFIIIKTIKKQPFF